MDPPVPEKAVQKLKEEKDPKKRQRMADPDLTDETLAFGPMRIGPGRAFELEAAGQRIQQGKIDSTPVAKRWLKMENRDLLFEAVDYADVKADLDRLPKKADNPVRKNGASLDSQLPSERVAQKTDKPITVANLPFQNKGLVMDYVYVWGGDYVTFLSNTTYLLEGGVYIWTLASHKERYSD